MQYARLATEHRAPESQGDSLIIAALLLPVARNTSPANCPLGLCCPYYCCLVNANLRSSVLEGLLMCGSVARTLFQRRSGG
jgi:hypothetical protein